MVRAYIALNVPLTVELKPSAAIEGVQWFPLDEVLASAGPGRPTRQGAAAAHPTTSSNSNVGHPALPKAPPATAASGPFRNVVPFLGQLRHHLAKWVPLQGGARTDQLSGGCFPPNSHARQSCTWLLHGHGVARSPHDAMPRSKDQHA